MLVTSVVLQLVVISESESVLVAQTVCSMVVTDPGTVEVTGSVLVDSDSVVMVANWVAVANVWHCDIAPGGRGGSGRSLRVSVEGKEEGTARMACAWRRIGWKIKGPEDGV